MASANKNIFHISEAKRLKPKSCFQFLKLRPKKMKALVKSVYVFQTSDSSSEIHLQLSQNSFTRIEHQAVDPRSRLTSSKCRNSKLRCSKVIVATVAVDNVLTKKTANVSFLPIWKCNN